MLVNARERMAEESEGREGAAAGGEGGGGRESEWDGTGVRKVVGAETEMSLTVAEDAGGRKRARGEGEGEGEGAGVGAGVGVGVGAGGGLDGEETYAGFSGGEGGELALVGGLDDVGELLALRKRMRTEVAQLRSELDAVRAEGRAMEMHLRTQLLEASVERDKYKAMVAAHESPSVVHASQLEIMLSRLLREVDLYKAKAKERNKFYDLYVAQQRIISDLRHIDAVTRTQRE